MDIVVLYTFALHTLWINFSYNYNCTLFLKNIIKRNRHLSTGQAKGLTESLLNEFEVWA